MERKPGILVVVDKLVKKLKNFPEDVRIAAFSEIQKILPSQSLSEEKCTNLEEKEEEVPVVEVSAPRMVTHSRRRKEVPKCEVIEGKVHFITEYSDKSSDEEGNDASFEELKYNASTAQSEVRDIEGDDDDVDALLREVEILDVENMVYVKVEEPNIEDNELEEEEVKRKVKRRKISPFMLTDNARKEKKVKQKVKKKKVSPMLTEDAHKENKVKPKAEKMVSPERSNSLLYCHECGYCAEKKSDLVEHMNDHFGDESTTCFECGKTFEKPTLLDKHLKQHTDSFSCEFCDYKASSHPDKKKHMAIHSDKRNHICEYCGKAFFKNITLKEHLKYVHERTKEYACATCGFTTYRRTVLDMHIRMRHYGVYKNHVCPVCNAILKQRSAFLEHMRRHTGERPHQCEECGGAFSCAGRLTAHKKSVHLPRQYQCSTCEKAFQTKHNLNRHQIVHSKEKPFSCPHCQFSCNLLGNLKYHIKTLHPIEEYHNHKVTKLLEESADPGWVIKGKTFTEEYLKELSSKLGRTVTIEELKMKEKEREERTEEELKKAIEARNLLEARRLEKIETEALLKQELEKEKQEKLAQKMQRKMEREKKQDEKVKNKPSKKNKCIVVPEKSHLQSVVVLNEDYDSPQQAGGEIVVNESQHRREEMEMTKILLELGEVKVEGVNKKTEPSLLKKNNVEASIVEEKAQQATNYVQPQTIFLPVGEDYDAKHSFVVIIDHRDHLV